MRHPRIDALDLRSSEGRLTAALTALWNCLTDALQAQINLNEAWKKSEEWINWDEITWDFPSPLVFDFPPLEGER